MKKVLQLFRSKFVVFGIIPLLLMALIIPNSNLRSQVSQAADNCPGTAPQQPAFNVWPLSYTPQECHDLPMVDARVINGAGRDGRYSQSQSEHSAGITAQPGDQIRVAVYFHNGASDQISTNQTTAHNTRVASIANPTNPTTDHTVSAAIVADNATPVYSSDPSVGGDFTIHTSTPTTLEYAPGTTIRYNHDGSIQNLPDGVYGGSVNIGDVLACFQYQGYVLYTLNVVGQTTPPASNATLNVTKLVKNDTQGGSFATSTNANPGNQVTFQVKVDNTSSVTATNVVVTDQLPTGLAYVAGSASVNPNSDFIHYPLGDIPANGSKTLTLSAQVQATSGTLTNTAIAKGDNTNQAQSSATVVISTPPPQGNAAIQLTKTVRNASGGLSNFAKNVAANQNDTVEFRLVVTNTGSVTAQNVNVSDTLPSGLQLSSGSLNSSVGSMDPGSSTTIYLQARVTTGTAGTYTNTATATASNAGPSTDTASVTVNQIIVNQPGQISITKGVRDLTQGQTAYVTNTNVFNGDTLQYRVTVTNTGFSPLTNLVVTDQIPSGLNFVPGSLGLSMGSGTTPSNITVSSLGVGQSVTINFNAVVNATSGSLTNTAQACADSVSCQTASATVNIISNVQQGTITITKLVRNVTQGGSFTTQVSANPGDRVAYQIRISASNGDVNNVVLTETMPQYLSYVNGTARLNGNNLSDNFINTNTNIGAIQNGQTSTVNFEATVSNSVPSCQTYASNTATVSADNIGTFSSTATVLINGGNCGGGGGFTQLAITKLVRDVNTNHTFAKTDTAAPNDTVEFQITVTNTGSLRVNNLFVNDILPQGLNFNSGTVVVDGTNNQGNLFNNNMFLGSLNPGQTRTILFRATVTSSGGATLINTAQAGGSNVSTVQDTATVFVQAVAGQNINLNFSKRAFNDTKNVDATTVPASREDFITYTLTVTNTGNAPATNFVITDDLSNVLNYASIVDSQGGVMNGNVISYPAVTIPAGGSISKTFKVRVKYSLPSSGSLTLVNTYGNTVVIQIAKPQVAGAVFVAPKTGSTMGYGFMFAGLLTAVFALLKRKGIFASVFARVPKIRFE